MKQFVLASKCSEMRSVKFACFIHVYCNFVFMIYGFIYLIMWCVASQKNALVIVTILIKET